MVEWYSNKRNHPRIRMARYVAAAHDKDLGLRLVGAPNWRRASSLVKNRKASEDQVDQREPKDERFGGEKKSTDCQRGSGWSF